MSIIYFVGFGKGCLCYITKNRKKLIPFTKWRIILLLYRRNVSDLQKMGCICKAISNLSLQTSGNVPQRMVSCGVLENFKKEPPFARKTKGGSYLVKG